MEILFLITYIWAGMLAMVYLWNTKPINISNMQLFCGLFLGFFVGQLFQWLYLWNGCLTNLEKYPH